MRQVQGPRLHVVRHDGVVHVVAYVEGPSPWALIQAGGPVPDRFRAHLRCGRVAKMYYGGRNRITRTHPTCVLCIAPFNEDSK